MPESTRDRSTSVAPRGHPHVSQKALDDVERAFRDDPLITVRAAAARAGVGHDTAHQVRRRLVEGGTLQLPGRSLNLARNRQRFRTWRDEHPDRRNWRPRQYRRNREVWVTLQLRSPTVDGRPAWMVEVSVPWLHCCTDDDPCGQIVNGESAPCRLLIEEFFDQTHRPVLLRKLTALMASPGYQRRVLGARPEVANLAASIAANRP